MSSFKAKTSISCLYCPDAFVEGCGSGEHVILSALGGQKETRNACCRGCNTRLGDTIDRELADQLAGIATSLGVVTGRKKPSRTFRRVDSGKGFHFDLGPRGAVRLSGPRVAGPIDGDGKQTVDIVARDMDEALRLALPHYKKLSEKFGEKVQVSAVEGSSFVEDQRMDISLGGPTQLRSIAKMMLNLFCTLVNPHRLRTEAFGRITAYINEGRPLPQGWITHDYVHDFPTSGHLSDIQHRIFVFANPDERVAYGLLELFGHLRFSALLTDEWDGPALGRVHIVEPTTGETLDAAVALPPAITKASLLARPFRLEDAGVALEKLIGVMQARMWDYALSEMTGKVLDRHFSEHDGEALTEDLVNKLCREMAEQYMALRFRVERSGQPTDITNIVRDLLNEGG